MARAPFTNAQESRAAYQELAHRFPQRYGHDLTAAEHLVAAIRDLP